MKRVGVYLEGEDAFCFTYGDGLSDINIESEIAFHRQHGRLATVAAVQPPGRYGALNIEGEVVRGFSEKPRGDGGRINGGFFVLSPKVLELIEGDETSWELEPLEQLAKDGELCAYTMTVFGSLWIPSGRKTYSKIYGPPVRRHGRCGGIEKLTAH